MLYSFLVAIRYEYSLANLSNFKFQESSLSAFLADTGMPLLIFCILSRKPVRGKCTLISAKNMH